MPDDQTEQCAEAFIEKTLPDYSGNALVRYGNAHESGKSQVLLNGDVLDCAAVQTDGTGVTSGRSTWRN